MSSGLCSENVSFLKYFCKATGIIKVNRDFTLILERKLTYPHTYTYSCQIPKLSKLNLLGNLFPVVLWIEVENSDNLLICAALNTPGLLSLARGTIALHQTMRSSTKTPMWKIVQKALMCDTVQGSILASLWSLVFIWKYECSISHISGDINFELKLYS